jgi:hypothetical protein
MGRGQAPIEPLRPNHQPFRAGSSPELVVSLRLRLPSAQYPRLRQRRRTRPLVASCGGQFLASFSSVAHVACGHRRLTDDERNPLAEQGSDAHPTRALFVSAAALLSAVRAWKARLSISATARLDDRPQRGGLTSRSWRSSRAGSMTAAGARRRDGRCNSPSPFGRGFGRARGAVVEAFGPLQALRMLDKGRRSPFFLLTW